MCQGCLGVAATNATVDTPQVAAANRFSVVDPTDKQEDEDEEDEDGNEDTVERFNKRDSDDEEEHPGGPRVLFKDSSQQQPVPTRGANRRKPRKNFQSESSWQSPRCSFSQMQEPTLNP